MGESAHLYDLANRERDGRKPVLLENGNFTRQFLAGVGRQRTPLQRNRAGIRLFHT
ncbi:hypothetical protein D3C74_507450 [compost metagenome]